MYFWDGAAEFYDCGLVDACQEAFAADEAAQEWLAALERDGHALAPPAADLTACQPQRTECDQMIFRARPSSVDPEYEIAWTAIPKHSDVTVTTHALPLAAGGVCPQGTGLTGSVGLHREKTFSHEQET